MPYANPFLRVTQTWQLPGAELANSSTSWDQGTGSADLSDTIADDFFARAATWWTAIRDLYPNTIAWTGIHIAVILEDGTVGTSLDRLASPNVGHATGNPTPNEVSMVASLRTASSTRRTRGRMYLPGLAVNSLTDQGRWVTEDCQTIADETAAMLAVLVSDGETNTAVVASATGGIFTPVTRVAVGNVPDSQRRRRDALIEAYSIADL